MQEFFKDVNFDKFVDWQYVSREREYEVNEMYVFIVLYYWVFILCYYVDILYSYESILNLVVMLKKDKYM